MTVSNETTTKATGDIWLRGARTQNLKGIDVEFPFNTIVAVTGVSGAGKTSLAVSTLAAEGQRRFIETFPAAARRFLERLERPDCDQIGPLPPAIIHRHHSRQAGKRSTVATLSEVSAILQQLFYSTGQIFCPKCDIPVVAHTAVSVAELIGQLPSGLRIQLGFSTQLDSATIADKSAADLIESGFQRIILDGKSLTLRFPLPLDWPTASNWDIVVDRLQTGRISTERLVDSLEISMQRGQGTCFVLLHGSKDFFPQLNAHEFTMDGEQIVRLLFHTRPICSQCQAEFSALNPRQFSFNSPLGACPKCRGLGSTKAGLCPACHGNRLRPESLSVRCGPLNFGELMSLTIREAVELGSRWPESISESSRQFAGPQFSQLQKRLEMLNRLGLGHLTLNRSAETLSTGEAQRLSLAATCAVELVNSLYVLEEPASGLHQRDIRQLIDVLKELKHRRNTVVLTEHVGEIIQTADVVIDLGPGAGPAGGKVIYLGSPAQLPAQPQSVTGDFLGGRESVKSPQPRVPSSWLKLSGVQFRNLKGINVEFPLGTLCAVTGVSGSGKSSLIRDTLHPALLSRLQQTADAKECGSYADLAGFEKLHSVVFVDQAVLEKSSRGNVATASGIWPEIRTLLADTPEAKLRQFTAGTFSFYSSSGGRCPHCEGRGTVAVDLQFLADLTIPCPECMGMRFQRDILEVKYRGHHVAEILDLTIRDALPFFRGKSRLQRQLKALKDVGLGFLQLGQPIISLSGGETQRLKLAARMMAKPSGATLFLLDEPARGLHPADIQELVNWFHDLLNEGHSFIVIEHRQELVRVADYVIELGPGAGPDGGRVMFHSKDSPMA